jgi:crotonobetainyl-CoA:carnitine CoA-transferase CaiB-like acyl-CoA transferase
MNLALGIMTALFVRERTGIGQKVEVSLLGTQLALQAPDILHYLHFGEERTREFRSSPTVGHYACSDGRWLMMAGLDQKFWPRIARALGREELATDPRFTHGAVRWANRHDLQPILESIFQSNTSAHWLQRLREEDVPVSPVLDYAGLASEEQASANGYIVEQEHPDFGAQRIIGLHIQLSGTPGTPGSPAPALGEHTRTALAELGLTEAELDELEARGVAGPARRVRE